MNTCQPEALSALLDGETTPEESAELHEHLARCPGCHQTYTAMAGLSGILVEHRPPALPKAFAEQTARAIKTPTPRWWNGLRALQNHPVRALVAPQRKRYL
jgi:predicted anti-sigma-YlaC factor YlaD